MNAPFPTTQLSLFFTNQPINQPTDNTPANLPFKDATQKQKPKPNRDLEKKLSELRRIHDELNETIYHTPKDQRIQISHPDDAAALVTPFLQNLDHEELWIILLDTRTRVLKLVKLYSGSVNSAAVRIGEVFKDAITESASAIILAHNHPSGDPTPSPDDVNVTRQVAQAGKLLDIDVLDHLIIGHNQHTSLKIRGLGFDAN